MNKELSTKNPEVALEIRKLKSALPILQGMESNTVRMVISLSRVPDAFELLAHERRQNPPHETIPVFPLRPKRSTIKVDVTVGELTDTFSQISAELDMVDRDARDLRAQYGVLIEKIERKTASFRDM
jgi:hypothetical protein